MKKDEINYRINIATQGFTPRGTNRGVHAHFHAG